MNTIQILINGAKGKMGQQASNAVSNDDRFKLVAEAGRADDLAAMIAEHSPGVVIDFTAASEAMQNTKIILESGARAVMGTSGFLPDDIQTIESLCQKKQLGAIIAPNFSIGALLMMQFAAQAAKFLPAIEIVEMHHDQKQDAPSGTALKTADMIAETRGSYTPVEGEALLDRSSRGVWHHNIPIHAIRIPGVIASDI